jgi:cytochrome P450
VKDRKDSPLLAFPLHDAGLSLLEDGAEQRLLAAQQQLGPTFGFYEPAMHRWMLASGEPAVAEHVLVKHAKRYRKGPFVGVVELLLGNGLMVSDGAFWREQRRKVQPAFHRQTVERVARLIERENRAAPGSVARARHPQREPPVQRSGLASDFGLSVRRCRPGR